MSRSVKRLFCVDLLRGFDIFYLLVVHYAILAPGVFSVWPLKAVRAKAFWLHSLTAFVEPGQIATGFGLLDFTQPLFIFVTGVSASLAFGKYLSDAGTLNRSAFGLGLLRRMVMLWFCGSLIRGLLMFRLFSGPAGTPSFVFYSDTLHTIAVAYGAAALGLTLRRAGVRLVLGLCLLAVPAVTMSVFGDYSRCGNAARLLEDYVYGLIGGRAKDFCYLLTTFTWAGMGILASLAGDVLKGALAPRAKVKVLLLAAGAYLAAGSVLAVWIPPIRYIYTISFVFLTQAGALVLLAFLYVMTDVLNIRRGMGLFILFGQCSLMAWMMMNFFGEALTAAAKIFVAGLPKMLGTAAYQPIFVGLARASILVILVGMWRKYRQARKLSLTGLTSI